jgi:hypothetical protein
MTIGVCDNNVKSTSVLGSYTLIVFVSQGGYLNNYDLWHKSIGYM